MLGAALDGFTARHKRFAGYAEKRIYLFFSTNMTANVCACCACTFGAGLIGAYGGSEWAYILAFSVMAVIWAQASLLSGFRRQWFFLFFAAAFLLLPHIFIDAADKETRAAQLTALGDVLAYISRLIPEYSLALLQKAGLEGLSATGAFLGCSAFLWAAGFYIRLNARHSRFYCKTRINQIN
ncbi:MAG: hypothetical protein ACI4J4_08690 [Ruminiclostridium sp.]